VIASKNKELLNYVLKFCQSRLSASTIEQFAAANLINTIDSYIEEVKEKYTARRDMIYKYLKEMPGVICPIPEGALYVLVQLPVDDSEKFAKWLLTDYSYENQTLLLAPGGGFYKNEKMGKNKVRLSFCSSEQDIENGMIVLKNALVEYNKLNK